MSDFAISLGDAVNMMQGDASHEACLHLISCPNGFMSPMDGNYLNMMPI